MTLVPGMIVEIKTISKKSYWLYRAYVNKIPKITCACRWKRGTLAVIDSVFDNGTVILIQKNNPSVVGVAHSSDVYPYYENEEED